MCLSTCLPVCLSVCLSLEVSPICPQYLSRLLPPRGSQQCPLGLCPGQFSQGLCPHLRPSSLLFPTPLKVDRHPCFPKSPDVPCRVVATRGPIRSVQRSGEKRGGEGRGEHSLARPGRGHPHQLGAGREAGRPGGVCPGSAPLRPTPTRPTKRSAPTPAHIKSGLGRRGRSLPPALPLSANACADRPSEPPWISPPSTR